MRDNRTGRLHDGTDSDGRPMAEWALDAIMESFQKRYKNKHVIQERFGVLGTAFNKYAIGQSSSYTFGPGVYSKV